MAISEDLAAEVLAKSARHCCVCRQYMPLAIQVHHIREKHDGGTDEFENLIPVCIQCHASIHTTSKMTRNFTERELKKSRDIVYDLVAAGRLPASNSMSMTEIANISAILTQTLRESTRDGSSKQDTLSNEAVEILSTMLCENAPAVIEKLDNNLVSITIGNQCLTKKFEGEGQYPDFIIEVLSKGLIQSQGKSVELTDSGEKLVNKLVQNTSTYTQKKIKCLQCGLHFIICTWDKERHNSTTVHCPECGQNDQLFMVWTQQKFGFIYEDVPGHAMLYDFMGQKQGVSDSSE